MRFDSFVEFYTNDRHYDPRQSKYVGDKKLLARIQANVTDVGTDRSAQVLGNLKINSKVIRTYEDIPVQWDYLMIDGHITQYRLITQRQPLKLHTLIVGENNGAVKD